MPEAKFSRNRGDCGNFILRLNSLLKIYTNSITLGLDQHF